jgi:hypothetical protein
MPMSALRTKEIRSNLRAFDDTQLALLICIGRALGLPRASITTFPDDVRWTDFVATATHHGMLSWLDLGLQGLADVPESVRHASREERLRCAQRNLLLGTELVRLSRALEATRIDVIAFKGPVGALQHHQDLSRRPSGDIDLLVHVQDWDDAASVLLGCGYQAARAFPGALQGSFWHPERLTVIDLHWGIPPIMLRFNERPLWRGRADIELLGERVPAFGAIDAIAVAAINLLKEYWKPTLHQVADVAAALSRLDAAGWRALRGRARQLRCERIVLAAGYICCRLFGNGFADQLVTDCIQSNPARVIAENVIPNLFSRAASIAHASPVRWSDETIFVDSAWHLKLQQLKHIVTPNEADTAFLPLPERLRFLHYLARPVRLALRTTGIIG